ncbi:MAG TPA: hypothetical protein DDW65_21665 [Firmicutes bacterium]|jgi:hypothetical protein|nr:hypothetical protein [Bacillota bacterium]
MSRKKTTGRTVEVISFSFDKDIAAKIHDTWKVTGERSRAANEIFSTYFAGTLKTGPVAPKVDLPANRDELEKFILKIVQEKGLFSAPVASSVEDTPPDEKPNATVNNKNAMMGLVRSLSSNRQEEK